MSILDNEFATPAELRAENKVLRERVMQLEKEAEMNKKLHELEINTIKFEHRREVGDLSHELKLMADMIKKMIKIAGDDMWWQRRKKTSLEAEQLDSGFPTLCHWSFDTKFDVEHEKSSSENI